MITLYIFLFSLLGAFLFRLKGGLIPGFSKTLSRILFSLPFMGPAIIGAFHAHTLPGVSLWIGAAIVSLVVTFIFVVTGHGEYQNYKEPLSGDPEKEDVLFSWFAKDWPGYWFKFTGMFANGGLIAISASCCANVLQGWIGLPILLSGWAQSLAYAIGWKIYPRQLGNKGLPGLNKPTEIGEALTGLFMYFGLGVAIAVLIAA